MKHIAIFNLVFTLIILVSGVFLYGYYRDFNLRLPSLQDIRQYEEKVKAQTKLESLRAHYLAHLQRLEEQQTPLKALAEYLGYLWLAMLVFLLVNVGISVLSLRHTKSD